jgi:hypothetical protein
MSVSNSPVNSLSTALSSVPSLVPTESLFPELARNIEWNNLIKTQETYQRILNYLDPNMSQYSIIKNLLIHSRSYYFKALESGLEVGTTQFESFFNESIKTNSMLISYLNYHGSNISSLLD